MNNVYTLDHQSLISPFKKSESEEVTKRARAYLKALMIQYKSGIFMMGISEKRKLKIQRLFDDE